MILLEILFH